MLCPGSAAASRRRAASPALPSCAGCLRALKPDILHNISLKPVLLGAIASLGLSSIAVVNSLTGLGTLFVGNHRKSELTRPLVVAALKALLKRRERPHHRAKSRRPELRARSRRA